MSINLSNIPSVLAEDTSQSGTSPSITLTDTTASAEDYTLTADANKLTITSSGGAGAAELVVDGDFIVPDGFRYKNDTYAGTFIDQSSDLLISANATVDIRGATVVINEAGADADFRVEGDTDANLLFTDASTDRVGIGTATPGLNLQVSGAIESDNLGILIKPTEVVSATTGDMYGPLFHNSAGATMGYLKYGMTSGGDYTDMTLGNDQGDVYIRPQVNLLMQVAGTTKASLTGTGFGIVGTASSISLNVQAGYMQIGDNNTAALPSINFGGYNHGFYSSSTILGVSVSGVSKATFDANNVRLNIPVRYDSTQGTGAGSALLGANSPASTLSAPYTWVTVLASDGSTCYLPIWK